MRQNTHSFLQVLFSPGVHRSTFSAQTMDDISPVFPMSPITRKDITIEQLESICPILPESDA